MYSSLNAHIENGIVFLDEPIHFTGKARARVEHPESLKLSGCFGSYSEQSILPSVLASSESSHQKDSSRLFDTIASFQIFFLISKSSSTRLNKLVNKIRKAVGNQFIDCFYFLYLCIMQTDLEEIKQILRELAISSKETDRKFQETDRKFQETTDRIVQELAISSKETDRKFQELAISSKETDRKMQETDKQLKLVSQQIGDLGNKFGYFTEGMALPTMEKLLETKFKLDTITPRFKKKLPDGKNLEFDILGYCNGTVNNAVVVEIKSKLRYEHIQEMAQEMKDFKINFPEFAHKHLYGIMVAIDVPSKELIDHVQKAGLYFARISDNIFSMTENEKAIDFNY